MNYFWVGVSDAWLTLLSWMCSCEARIKTTSRTFITRYPFQNSILLLKRFLFRSDLPEIAIALRLLWEHCKYRLRFWAPLWRKESRSPDLINDFQYLKAFSDIFTMSLRRRSIFSCSDVYKWDSTRQFDPTREVDLMKKFGKSRRYDISNTR